MYEFRNVNSRSHLLTKIQLQNLELRPSFELNNIALVTIRTSQNHLGQVSKMLVSKCMGQVTRGDNERTWVS